jgi:hypothetical protein
MHGADFDFDLQKQGHDVLEGRIAPVAMRDQYDSGRNKGPKQHLTRMEGEEMVCNENIVGMNTCPPVIKCTGGQMGVCGTRSDPGASGIVRWDS